MHNSVTFYTISRHLSIKQQLKTQYYDNFKFKHSRSEQEKGN